MRLAAEQRLKRWDMLLARFPDLGEMRVLDLGGWGQEWLAGPARPAELVLVNLARVSARDATRTEEIPWMRTVAGDACDSDADWGHFDLVYSNSVIEHVGGHERRERFAATVHRHGDHHWVQTPYRYFPIEPHYRLPFVQHLPLGARAALWSHWPYATANAVQRANSVRETLKTELLAWTDLRYYFPDSDLLAERFAGLPKSMIATR